MNDELLQHVDRLILQRPAAADVLQSYKELLLRMEEADFPDTEVHIRLDPGAFRLKEGFPVFSREDLPIDFTGPSRRLSAGLEHLIRKERKDKDAMKAAWAAAEKDSGWAERLFTALLRRDEALLSELAEGTGLDRGVLHFLGKAALAPSLQSLRDAISGQVDLREWDQGYCPVCGSEPNMAYFAKGGGRFLHCEFCGKEWPYPRLKCPFCRNGGQATLGYFQAEEEEGFRVYFCRKCKRYIKTVDRSVFEEPAPMELEYMATLHLDLAAGERGFD